MAKKDLIIGAFKNYSFETLKPWVNSINEHFKGDKVIISINSSDETNQKLADSGFHVVATQSQMNMMFHMERFIHIYNFLKENAHNYRYVISTDVRDVILQDDPMKKLELYLDEETDYVAVAEGIQLKNEAWNRDNVNACFGPFFYEQIKDNEIYNVGLLAGKSEHIRDLCAMLFQLSFNRADWVADQAAYNILLNWEPYKSKTFITTLPDGWACNLHVTNKPEQMEEFGPHLLYPRPVFKEGVVMDSTGIPFAIVHQYDRVPEINKYIKDKYGVVDLITINTNNDIVNALIG